jgi:hypothetical protein
VARPRAQRSPALARAAGDRDRHDRTPRDIVATEPIARHVRAMHPQAHIVWAVRDAYREMVEHNPNVDEVCRSAA